MIKESQRWDIVFPKALHSFSFASSICNGFTSHYTRVCFLITVKFLFLCFEDNELRLVPGDELLLQFLGDAAHLAWQSMGHVQCGLTYAGREFIRDMLAGFP
ncbi:hypothetical protein CJ030_MR0G013388 [Morella rubra]|uniref:Uncharacterized protein n=1 Tax=Morella rubra TaxID=262757 RepID=A0A6A1UHQ1_9ROSI|nr:hypothetical protein CJ030_MR0G013384 [Morella rubra]KAB1199791.1 hypothetical protein CJ030_MR0G013388 [Morella rubra]